MAASIKLMRFGKKNAPFYRIIVCDKKNKRNGAYIEKLGIYDPMTNPATVKFDKESLDKWIMKGAILSEGIKKLLNK